MIQKRQVVAYSPLSDRFYTGKAKVSDDGRIEMTGQKHDVTSDVLSSIIQYVCGLKKTSGCVEFSFSGGKKFRLTVEDKSHEGEQQ